MLQTTLLGDDCWDRIFSREAFCIGKDSRAVRRGRDRHVLSDLASNFALTLLVAAWKLATSVWSILGLPITSSACQISAHCIKRQATSNHIDPSAPMAQRRRTSDVDNEHPVPCAAALRLWHPMHR